MFCSGYCYHSHYNTKLDQRKRINLKTLSRVKRFENVTVWKRCFPSVDGNNDAIWKQWRHRNNTTGLQTAFRLVSTSANSVARTGTIACSSIEKKKSDWLSLILVAKKLNLIQLPELTTRSPVNARFQLGFQAAHALIVSSLGRAAEFAEVEIGLSTVNIQDGGQTRSGSFLVDRFWYSWKRI